MKCEDEIELVFPTEDYKEQIEDYLKEHFDNGEYELNGDGGLDKLKDFEKWLEKINSDLTREFNEDKVPATLFMGVRKKDNRVVGLIQIRHKLNKKLLYNCGHIGYGVRPSERRKGYVGEMLRLALEECKKLEINRVLVCCYEDNTGSRKAIINNGGVLENEFPSEDGKHTEQRYWISLKKRYADTIKNYSGIDEIEQKIEYFEDEYFKGDVFLDNFKKVSVPKILPKGLTFLDTDYKWLEFYDYNQKVKLTAVYDNNNEMVEWYFDIARKIGKENGVPYEDDLYLDVVLTPTGEVINLDEDEFEEAYKRLEFTKEEYDEAYKIRDELANQIRGKHKELSEFTDKYLYKMLER